MKRVSEPSVSCATRATCSLMHAQTNGGGFGSHLSPGIHRRQTPTVEAFVRLCEVCPNWQCSAPGCRKAMPAVNEAFAERKAFHPSPVNLKSSHAGASRMHGLNRSRQVSGPRAFIHVVQTTPTGGGGGGGKGGGAAGGLGKVTLPLCGKAGLMPSAQTRSRGDGPRLLLSRLVLALVHILVGCRRSPERPIVANQ